MKSCDACDILICATAVTYVR